MANALIESSCLMANALIESSHLMANALIESSHLMANALIESSHLMARVHSNGNLPQQVVYHIFAPLMYIIFHIVVPVDFPVHGEQRAMDVPCYKSATFKHMGKMTNLSYLHSDKIQIVSHHDGHKRLSPLGQIFSLPVVNQYD